MMQTRGKEKKWKFPNFFSGKFQYIFLGKSHSIGEGGREGAISNPDLEN